MVGIITTNADGLAQTNAKALPYGTYYIEETKPSLGYKKDTAWGFTVRYREGQERAGTKAAETQKKVVKRRTLVYDDTSFMELRETGTA